MPTEGYEQPDEVPPGSALDLVHFHVKWDQDQFAKTRSIAKRRAKAAQWQISGLNGLIAVTAAIGTALDPSPWGVAIVALSSIASFLAAREAHSNNRGIWIRQTSDLAKLQNLERRISLMERLEDRSSDDAFAQEAMTELEQIRASSVTGWEGLDRARIGSDR